MWPPEIGTPLQSLRGGPEHRPPPAQARALQSWGWAGRDLAQGPRLRPGRSPSTALDTVPGTQTLSPRKQFYVVLKMENLNVPTVLAIWNLPEPRK